jgi:hypothetical protein
MKDRKEKTMKGNGEGLCVLSTYSRRSVSESHITGYNPSIHTYKHIHFVPPPLKSLPLFRAYSYFLYFSLTKKGGGGEVLL